MVSLALILFSTVLCRHELVERRDGGARGYWGIRHSQVSLYWLRLRQWSVAGQLTASELLASILVCGLEDRTVSCWAVPLLSHVKEDQIHCFSLVGSAAIVGFLLNITLVLFLI